VVEPGLVVPVAVPVLAQHVDVPAERRWRGLASLDLFTIGQQKINKTETLFG